MTLMHCFCFCSIIAQGKKGAIIGDRYELHSDVGLGTFGRVVECWDLKRRRRVAVKVVRKVSARRKGVLQQCCAMSRSGEYNQPLGFIHLSIKCWTNV